MDPQQIIAPPADKWVWLAPDWSDYSEGDKAPAGKSGWTHVKIRETHYADGRIVRNVLDADGQPVSAQGTPATTAAPARVLDTDPALMIDKDQEKRFKDSQTQQQRGDQEGDIRGAQTGPTREVYRSGKWVVEPNPVYQPPVGSDPTSAAGRKAEQEAAGEAALNAERSWNSQHGYGWVTHGERETAIRAQQTQARADGNQERLVKAQEDANQLAKDRLQFDKDKANLPDVKTTDIPVNGVHYTHVVSTTPQGQTTITNYGPDGKPIDRLPSDLSNPTTPGPTIPNFVLGASVDALTRYKKELQEGVAAGRWSQDWADKRWGEAYQVAQFANNEHVIQQREGESQLNARTNLATTKLTTMQTGLGNALSFVNSINGTLPPGSSLGGQAFAALLGLQMLLLERSGIDDIDPRSARAPVPTVTPADLADPAKLAAKRDEIGGHLDAATVPPANAAAIGPVAAGVTATNAAAIDPSGANVEAANQAVQAGSGAAFGGLGVTAQPPAAEPPPTAAEPGGPPLQPGPVLGDPAPAPAPAPLAAGPRDSGDTVTITHPGLGAPISAPRYMIGEGPGQYRPSQGWTIVSDPKATSAPVTLAPPSDFAALAQYQAPAPPPLPGLGATTPPTAPDDGQPPLAMLRAQLAATPPWRLTEDQFAQAQANGLEAEARAVPGEEAA